jgi:AraC-like DNA-binding protein
LSQKFGAAIFYGWYNQVFFRVEITYIVFALASGSLLLLAFLFLVNIPKVNPVANRWLAVFYLCLSFAFLQQFSERTGLHDEHPLLIHILELTRFALAPSFYIAICYFVNPGRKTTTGGLHFIPATAFLLYSLFYIIPDLFQPATAAPDLPSYFVFTLRYFSRIQAIVYLVLSFQALMTHAKNIRLIASRIDSIDLSWIRHLLVGTIVMTLVWISSRDNTLVLQLTPIIYFAGVLYIGYHSLRQEAIYPVDPTDLREISLALNERKRQERLTSRQVDELKEVVLNRTRAGKLYLNPDLNLPALSKEVGINTHELSYVLNDGLQKNFYQFINELRVEEAKSLLLSEKAKQLDMIGVATLAGFNSKTTFNTTFKKLTGQTPTEYLKANAGKSA